MTFFMRKSQFRWIFIPIAQATLLFVSLIGNVGAGLSATQQQAVAEIRDKIEKFWLRPPGAGDRGLRSVVEIRLGASGAVLLVKVVESSGNSAFDRSVEAAVKKADPLPIPHGTEGERFRQLELVFQPSYQAADPTKGERQKAEEERRLSEKSGWYEIRDDEWYRNNGYWMGVKVDTEQNGELLNLYTKPEECKLTSETPAMILSDPLRNKSRTTYDEVIEDGRVMAVTIVARLASEMVIAKRFFRTRKLCVEYRSEKMLAWKKIEEKERLEREEYERRLQEIVATAETYEAVIICGVNGKNISVPVCFKETNLKVTKGNRSTVYNMFSLWSAGQMRQDGLHIDLPETFAIRAQNSAPYSTLGVKILNGKGEIVFEDQAGKGDVIAVGN